MKLTIVKPGYRDGTGNTLPVGTVIETAEGEIPAGLAPFVEVAKAAKESKK